MKATPKSCSCRACRRGAHSAFGHCIHHNAEVKLRQKAKKVLKDVVNGGETEVDLPAAPHSSYTD